MSKDFITIKVHTATRERIEKIAQVIRERGWKAVGSKRTDAPTTTAIVEEALGRLRKGRGS